MSDMKCPICNDGKIITNLDGTYECDNPECSICDGTHTETFEALIRTRKALDVAKDTFNWIDETYRTGQDTEAEIWGKVQLAAREITALEQKESVFVHNKIEFPEFNDNLLEEFDKQFFEDGQDDDLTETALEQKDVK